MNAFTSEEQNTIQTLINTIADKYRQQLANDGVNASGKLSNFTTEYTYDDQAFILYFNLEEYWYYVENGRKAGKMPPIEAIEKWIQVKPITPIPDAKGKIPSTKSLAFMIARKIGREGYEGRHSLAKSVLSTDMDATIQSIKQVIADNISENIKKEIYNSIS